MAFDVEDGFRYAVRLRGNPATMNPPNWEVTWADAPWPVKIYDGRTEVLLPVVGPRWVPRNPVEDEVLDRLGRLLQLSVGFTRTRIRPDGQVLSSPERPMPQNSSATLTARRALASGGSLYPAEVYLCAGTLAQRVIGTYHYDPIGHKLTRLTAERPEQRLALALNIVDITVDAADQAMLVVTNLFWKSFYKYGDFSYRLGAVDVGIAAARLHRLAVAEFGEASLHFDFDDEAVNSVLQIDGLHESVYAVIRLRTAGIPGSPVLKTIPPDATGSAAPVSHQRSRNIRRSPDFDAMHASARSCVRDLPPLPPDVLAALPATTEPGSRVALPPPLTGVLDDLSAAVFARTSNGELFAGESVRAEAMATALRAAAEAIADARAAARREGLPAPVLYVIAQRTIGVSQGAYRYDPSTGALSLLRSGDLGLALVACTNIRNVNLDLGAFTVHIADTLDFRRSERGNRTNRIQQMLVGAALDAIMLVCAALGLGCHPMLGFNAADVDALYELQGTPVGTLAQICVGTIREGYHIDGGSGA